VTLVVGLFSAVLGWVFGACFLSACVLWQFEPTHKKLKLLSVIATCTPGGVAQAYDYEGKLAVWTDESTGRTRTFGSVSMTEGESTNVPAKISFDQQDDLDWKQSHWSLAGFYFPQSPDPDWPGSHIWLRSTAHCELVLR
jgi:hypothetical protein